MNIYDQLIKLQIIEDAWKQWQFYRTEVTEYLIEQLKHKNEVAILGAGRCNDIDLKYLLQYFKKIVLVDLDYEAMKEALKQQGLQSHPHITLMTENFVGITPNDYRNFADQLVYTVRQKGLDTSVDQLTQVASTLLDGFYEQVMHTSLKLNNYENIVVIGVHSQLITMLDWIWQAVLQTLGKEEGTVREKIITLNTMVVKRFNEALLKSANKQLVIGYEIERLGRNGAIQGALQAAIDFNKRVEKHEVKLCDFRQMNWPFDLTQGIIYHMGIFTLETIKG